MGQQAQCGYPNARSNLAAHGGEADQHPRASSRDASGSTTRRASTPRPTKRTCAPSRGRARAARGVRSTRTHGLLVAATSGGVALRRTPRATVECLAAQEARLHNVHDGAEHGERVLARRRRERRVAPRRGTESRPPCVNDTQQTGSGTWNNTLWSRDGRGARSVCARVAIRDEKNVVPFQSTLCAVLRTASRTTRPDTHTG